MITFHQTLFVVGAIALASPTYAAVEVYLSSGAPASPEQATIVFDAKTGAWDIELLSLYSPAGQTWYEVRGTGVETIDNLLISIPCWLSPGGSCMVAGSPVYIKVLNVAQVNNILQIEENTDLTLVRVDTVLDIGRVECNDIGELRSGRDILGPIIATHPDDAGRGINIVRAARHITGDITALNGRIINVYSIDPSGCCYTGFIGMENNPINISAKYGVHQIAGLEAHANIITNAEDGNGAMNALVVNRFTGSVRTDSLIVSMFNPNSFGRVTVPIEFDGTIVIDNAFESPDFMVLPPRGLKGQIIINAANNGGVWNGLIKLGSDGDPNQIVINGSDYSQTADDLGGGSIGIAPFALHDEACVPSNGSTVGRDLNDPPLAVKLRHYGPIQITGPTPVTVNRRATGTNDLFVPLASSQFTYSIAPSDSNSLLVTPVKGFAGFEAGFDYRILATTNLRCDLVTGNPAVVWDGSFDFTVETMCDGDTNDDTIINVSDLLLVLATWGTPGSGDVDGSGVTDVSDLLMVLANWGVCP